MQLARPIRMLLLPCCAFAGGACATAIGGGARSAHGDTPYAAVEQLGRVLVEVENEYVDPVDRAKLVNGAIKGMVAELDPHSSYMPPEEFQAFESDTEGQFGGIGIEVESRNDQLVVLAPIEGSPAERKGVKSGDLIVSVDGKDPGQEPLDKLVIDSLSFVAKGNLLQGARAKGAEGRCDCLHGSTPIVGCLTAGIKLSKLPTSAPSPQRDVGDPPQ